MANHFYFTCNTCQVSMTKSLAVIVGTSVYCNKCNPNECGECATTPVPHNNCLYGGKAIGHSATHCTANACY